MNLNPFENREIDFNCKALFNLNYSWCEGIKPTMKELFGEEYGDYAILLKGINKDVSWKVKLSSGSYQGEHYFAGVSDEKFYYYQTGYGSCSGCDWYQSKHHSLAGLQSVQDEIKRNIREFDSKQELKDYINEKVDFYGDDASRKELLSCINDNL